MPGSFAAASERTTELDERVAADPGRFRVLTGERPTGRLHLGHLFGTVQNRVRLQRLGVDTMVVLADYQVITDRDAVADVAEHVRSAVVDYLAAGLDPERTTIFTHSAVPALNQLMLPFLSLVTEAELRRNPTVKAEHLGSGRALSALMLTYPVHQAADILFCKANLVPVGKDNLPHVEVARAIARRFNTRFGEVFPVPHALITSTPEVPGLDGRKMSKSHGNAIALSMTPDETATVIRRTPTDHDRHIDFDPERRPGVASLLATAALCTGLAPETIAAQVGGSGSAALKDLTIEAVNGLLGPHRERRAELEQDLARIDRILDAGNARARELAENTLRDVRSAMGMHYSNPQ